MLVRSRIHPMAPKRNPQRGERIRALRTDRQLTQQALAHAVGASVRAVQLWEAGGEVSWPNVVQLARVCHTSPEYILGADGDGAIAPEDQVTARLQTLESRIGAEHAKHDGQVRDAFERLAGLIHGGVADVEDVSRRVAAVEAQLRELTLAQQELTTALTRSLLETSALAPTESGGERRRGRPDRRTGS